VLINKTFAVILFTTTIFASANASAQDFTGPRVGVELGISDDSFLGSEETSWGVNAGYDFDLGKLVVGGTVGYTDVFGDDFDFRELSVGGKLGAKLTESALLYGTVAYSDIDVAGLSVDGARFGVGAEVNVTPNVFVNLETRYGTYDYDLELYQTVIGVGYRF